MTPQQWRDALRVLAFIIFLWFVCDPVSDRIRDYCKTQFSAPVYTTISVILTIIYALFLFVIITG